MSGGRLERIRERGVRARMKYRNLLCSGSALVPLTATNGVHE